MPPSKVAVPAEAARLYEAYLAWSSSRGVGNKTFDSASRTFLVRFPEPQAWASQPLEVRLRANGALRPFLNFCMFSRLSQFWAASSVAASRCLGRLRPLR